MFLLFLVLARVVLAIKITGAGGGGGGNGTYSPQPLRYEINDFCNFGPAWDLFVQALTTIQSRDQSDPMSYFQIAGIHGYPQIPWDGVNGSGDYPGYCMHSDQLFLPWHRPYLALYEQAIWQAAQAIADSYPDENRSVYQSAALSLRIPYWDTIANPSMPPVTTTPLLLVNTPTGKEAVSNPLFNYTFKSDAVGNGFPSSDQFATFPWTVRWFSGQSSNQSAATVALQSNAANLLMTTYQIFTSVSDYMSVSTTAPLPNGTPNSGNNLESIHNAIHNSVGGQWGHMIDPAVAAFDPIFWLHHANVDRQFAMWQALYSNAYVQRAANNFGSYYEVAGSSESSASFLAPFHDTDDGSTMWTSDGVRSIAVYRYSYPELPYWRLNSSALRQNVINEVNRLYNPLPTQRKRSILLRDRSVANLAQEFSDITYEDAKAMGINNVERQWFAKIGLRKYAYNTTFTILAFMGDPPVDVNQWSWAPNLIGTHAQFITSDVPSMFPNGAPSGDVQGSISLTHTLVAGAARGIIPNLEPETVVPLFQEGLQWRARAADGCEIDITKLVGLSITVGSRSVTPTTTLHRFPVYNQIEWHPELTRNAPCGAKQWYRLAR